MDRTVLPQGDVDKEKGVWSGLARNSAVYDDKGLLVKVLGRSAVVSCPECGKAASLTDHTIEENGEVNPSLVCPHDCEFHEYVTLDGWVPNPRKTPTDGSH